MPSFEFIQALIKPANKEVCLTAFIDESLAEFIELESACKEYKILPQGGGLLDQLAIYLDAFQVIRGEKVKYENKRNKEAMANIKKPTSESKPKRAGRLG